MNLLTRSLRNFALLGTALTASLSMAPSVLHAQDRTAERNYHDARHNDDHTWNSHEDRAYRMWVKENHRRYTNFDRLKEDDRQAYWDWRHEHSDVQLKINIR